MNKNTQTEQISIELQSVSLLRRIRQSALTAEIALQHQRPADYSTALDSIDKMESDMNALSKLINVAA